MSDYEYEANFEKYKDDADEETAEASKDDDTIEACDIAFRICDHYHKCISRTTYNKERKDELIKEYIGKLIILAEMKNEKKNIENYFPGDWFEIFTREMIMNLKGLCNYLVGIKTGPLEIHNVFNTICEIYENFIELKTVL